jgi:hypothetical protein
MDSNVGAAMTSLRDGEVKAAATSLRISLEPAPMITPSVETPFNFATSAVRLSTSSSG